MTSPFAPNRVRALFFVQKKEGISYEEWSRYWREEHAQIVLGVELLKKNFLKYEQLHVNQVWKERLCQNPRIKVPDYDGVVLFEAESLEKIVEVVQDPQYLDKVVPDAKLNLFKLENTVHGAFDIATIIDKSPKYTKPEVGGIVRPDIGRLLMPLRKKDGLAQAQFNHHWLNVHAPLISPLLATNSVSKYEQLHIHQGPGLTPGNTSEWDGVAVFEAESIAKALEDFADSGFMKVAVGDGVNFLSNQPSEMLPCDVITLIDK